VGVWSASGWAGELQRQVELRRRSLASARKLFREAFYGSLGVLQIDVVEAAIGFDRFDLATPKKKLSNRVFCERCRNGMGWGRAQCFASHRESSHGQRENHKTGDQYHDLHDSVFD
jgi:hypothetical protein